VVCQPAECLVRVRTGRNESVAGKLVRFRHFKPAQNPVDAIYGLCALHIKQRHHYDLSRLMAVERKAAQQFEIFLAKYFLNIISAVFYLDMISSALSIPFLLWSLHVFVCGYRFVHNKKKSAERGSTIADNTVNDNGDNDNALIVID